MWRKTEQLKCWLLRAFSTTEQVIGVGTALLVLTMYICVVNIDRTFLSEDVSRVPRML